MSDKAPETAEQWWDRVRAEHGPAPKSVREVWTAACRRSAERRTPQRSAS